MRETVFARPGTWRLGTVMFVAVLALVGAVMVGGRAAQAHDHQLPETVLMEGKDELQAGRKVGWSDWHAATGDGTCVYQHADYLFGFPRADEVAAGTKLRVRIYKVQKPSSFQMAEVDRQGAETREVRVRLKPVIKNDRTVAWDAVFRVSRPDTDYRLLTEGHWKDREGCNADQSAFWSFHVRTGTV